jgi:hypothetical protein
VPTGYAAGNSGTSLAINWSNGQTQTITNTGACALTFSNQTAYGTYVLVITAGSGANANWSWSSDSVKWVSGEPTLSTTLNSVDVITLLYIGTTWYGFKSGLGYA